MTNRYTIFEATAAGYTSDTHTFTANEHIIDVVTEELTPERNNIYPVTSKGRTPRRKLKGPLGWTGNIETLFYTLEAPSLIYYAMGGDTTTGVGPYRHISKPAATIPHFILETGRDQRAHKYTGCVATGFTIEYAPDSAITLNVDINARKEQANAALQTEAFPDFDSAERTFGGVEVVTAIGAAEGGSPSDFATVESFSLTYDNNFEDSAYTLSSQFLSGNFVNQINVTGSMELSFLQIADYDDVVGDVEKQLWLTANNGLATTFEREIILKMDRISYDSTTLPTNNAERYVQSLEFTCNDNAAGNALEVEVLNNEDGPGHIA
jgi:hypothetical protein